MSRPVSLMTMLPHAADAAGAAIRYFTALIVREIKSRVARRVRSGDFPT